MDTACVREFAHLVHGFILDGSSHLPLPIQQVSVAFGKFGVLEDHRSEVSGTDLVTG